MIAFAHTAVGASVGLITSKYLENTDPLIGLAIAAAAGIVSHYITDLLPHGHLIRFQQYKSRIIGVILFDLLLSIVVFSGAAYLIGGINLKTLFVLFGIAGSQLPDMLDGLIYTGFLHNKGIIKLENDLHIATHWHGQKTNALMWGKRDVWQVFVVISSFVYIVTS